jgi:hypothetical protein
MTQGRFHAFALSLVKVRHRGAATLAALPLVAALAACGGGGARLSKSAYELRIQKDGREIRSVFAPLARPPSSLKVLAAEIKTGQDKLRSAAADLGGLAAPADIRHDNDVLASGLRKLADELDPLRAGAGKGDVRAVQSALNTLQRSKVLQRAQRAIADMKKKGYRVGTLGA